MSHNKQQIPSDCSSVEFRPATPADRPALIPLINAAYARETFLEGTRTDDTRLASQMQTGTILVAEDSRGQLLACAYVEVRGPRGYLGQLAVAPEHQGSSLARRIVRAAEDHLRRQGCHAVDITVLSLRTELPPIYSRFGYIETGIEPFHTTQSLAPGAECHCIVMSKSLIPDS